MSVANRTIEVTPFALLQALERRIRTGSIAISSDGGPQTWDGLAFRVRQQWCAAPSGEVREVLPVPSYSRIPGAKPWLLGLANVRGAILPMVDLGAALKLPRMVSQPLSRLLILSSARDPIGFLVDETAGQRRFAPAEQHHEALTVATPFSPFALGAFERAGVVQLAISLKRLAGSEELADAGW